MFGKNSEDSIEVNKIVQPRICKVITPNHSGVGYRYDQNYVVTSFHLVGSILPVKYSSNNEGWLTLLFVHDYIDAEHRLTSLAYRLQSPEDISVDIDEECIYQEQSDAKLSAFAEVAVSQKFPELNDVLLQSCKNQFFDFIQENFWERDIRLTCNGV